MPKYIPLPAKGPLTKPNQTKNQTPTHAMPMQLHTEHGTMLWAPERLPCQKESNKPKKQSQKEEAPKRALHQAMQWQCRVAAALVRYCTHPNTAAHAPSLYERERTLGGREKALKLTQ